MATTGTQPYAMKKKPRSRRGQSHQPREGHGTVQTDGHLGVITEAGEDDISPRNLGEHTPRARYVSQATRHPPQFTRFLEYLASTGIEAKFRNLLRTLLAKPELPYNPYPWFVRKARVTCEKFHMERELSSRIAHSLNNPLKETYVQNLYTVKNSEEIWGLAGVLKVVSIPRLHRYKWLVEDSTPLVEGHDIPEEYTMQVMVALVGPIIFEGTFYEESHFIQMRLEYLITGPEETRAKELFVTGIMVDIEGMFTSQYNLFQGVTVPTKDASGANWQNYLWDKDTIESNKDTFRQSLLAAVTGFKYIDVECVFLREPEQLDFIKGKKQYGLNYIQVVQGSTEEGLRSFCEFPLRSLHDGVFFSRSHAEAYISMSQQQMPSGIEDYQKITPDTEDNENAQADVHSRLDQVKPRKVVIDGFRYGDPKTGGPYSWQITTPIIENLQRGIASNYAEAELMETIYYTVLLVVISRKSLGDGILVEVYRILHGTAGPLYLLTEQSRALALSVETIANSKDFMAVPFLLKKYRDSAERIFSNILQEQSRDREIVGQVVMSRIDELLHEREAGIVSTSYIQKVLGVISNLGLYCLTLLMEVCEDSLQQGPKLQDLIRQMKQTFPELARRPGMRTKGSAPVVKGREPEPHEEELFSHGLEDEHVMRHETSVLDVALCMERETAPKNMMKESVLMKYMLDSHLDHTWNDFLIELSGEDAYPPNPYPRLISILRKNAVRMDICHEKPSAIVSRLTQVKIKGEDDENFVYTVPGLEAHGFKTAVQFVDQGTYVPLTAVVKKFVQKNYVQRKGTYKVAVCLCIAGTSAWYGKLRPYLTEIHLDEHYYIQGPSGCQGEAIQMCASIVYTHVVDCIKNMDFPIMGVYFDGAERWRWDDILKKERGFIEHFAKICSEKKQIYMKAYVVMEQWRYVPVYKYFRLHFLEQGVARDVFYPEDGTAFYSSIFLTKERAAFHYQNGGPPPQSSPMSIMNKALVFKQIEKSMFESQRENDWIRFYQHLVMRDIISEDVSHLADAWRMFNSHAAQVEYVIVLADSLQDLTRLFLEFKPYEEQEELEKKEKEKKKKGRQEEKSERKEYKNRVQSAVVDKMVLAFRQKLQHVCQSQTTMTSRALPDFLVDKLNLCMEMDAPTGRVLLITEEQTIDCLEETKVMLRLLQDTLSADVRSIGHDVNMTYKPSLEEEEEPGSEEQTMATVQDQTNSSQPIPLDSKHPVGKPRELTPELPEVIERKLPKRVRPKSVTSIDLNDSELFRSRHAQMEKPEEENQG